MDWMDKTKNSWICQSERTLISSPVISIVEQICRSSEDQREHTFYQMRSHDWCNIIPVTEDGKIVLIRQYRIGIAAHTLEVPGGVADPTDVDLQAAAVRELEEETGYAPLPGARCVSLGWTHPNPAILNNRCHSFVVGPVKRVKAQSLDPGEMIDVEEVTLNELAARIERGEITHALMLNAFFFLLMRSREGSGLLARELQAFSAT
jgi:ADP-ribose pyrophosphatase